MLKSLFYLGLVGCIGVAVYQSGSLFAAWCVAFFLPIWLWMNLRSEPAK